MLPRCLQRVRKNITDSLHPFIRNFRGRIALYDVATHADVGDNLLWKGALDVMFTAARSPDLICSLTQADARMQGPRFPTCPPAAKILDELGTPALILWQAGGNFGDPYRNSSTHHSRMQLIQHIDELIDTEERFQSYQLDVVQLPQSVAYTSEATTRAEASVLRSLRNVKFVLATRTAASFDFAFRRMRLNEVLAVPDIAMASGPFLSAEPPVVDIVFMPGSCRQGGLAPTAMEVAVEGAAAAAGLTYKWVTSTNGRVDAYAAGFDSAVNLPQPLWSSMAAVRTASGVSLVSQGQVVVTDLTHVVILAMLSGRPVFFWDGGAQAGHEDAAGTYDMIKSASGCGDDDLGAFHFTGTDEADALSRATNAAVEYVLKSPCPRAQQQS
ncbi:MAG: hypothetical protein WDW36_009025 [Sanguina aurantia]